MQPLVHPSLFWWCVFSCNKTVSDRVTRPTCRRWFWWSARAQLQSPTHSWASLCSSLASRETGWLPQGPRNDHRRGLFGAVMAHNKVSGESTNTEWDFHTRKPEFYNTFTYTYTHACIQYVLYILYTHTRTYILYIHKPYTVYTKNPICVITYLLCANTSIRGSTYVPWPHTHSLAQFLIGKRPTYSSSTQCTISMLPTPVRCPASYYSRLKWGGGLNSIMTARLVRCFSC